MVDQQLVCSVLRDEGIILKKETSNLSAVLFVKRLTDDVSVVCKGVGKDMFGHVNFIKGQLQHEQILTRFMSVSSSKLENGVLTVPQNTHHNHNVELNEFPNA